ncbi:transglycosylase domain-containing protein [Rubritalea sp.]|uniref:transglycosylase domain-containing protein n=1 Tax=Rubritalea sp. TaxID=2109375 RepID=UPI003EF3EBB1
MGIFSALALYTWYVLPFSVGPLDLQAINSSICQQPLSAEQHFSTLLVDATLAAEDKRFYHHGGIDLCANMRAIKDAIEAQRFVSGASTITQQTVKLLTHTPPRTLETKCTEALYARNLEMRHNKEAILFTYFELLEYGNRTRGPEQAAKHYFNKRLHTLTLPEAALLAGLPQAPSRLNPRKNPESAIKRRNWILERMSIVRGYSAEQVMAAQAAPLDLYIHAESKSNKLALKESPQH